MDHAIIHFEVPANDVKKLKQFYEEVFSWRIIQASGPIEYWVIETVPVDSHFKLLRTCVNGGMYEEIVPESKLLNYFAVESISDFLTKIEKMSRKVT